MGAAHLLALCGANVALFGRRARPPQEVAEAVTAAGGLVAVLVGDVTDLEALDRAVTQTVARFGDLHGAVGLGRHHHNKPFVTVLSMRAELPAIERSGFKAIVSISSVFADRGLAQPAAYSVSRHGVRTSGTFACGVG